MEWMIYGANGYTGRLVAAEAVRRGLRPVLAGRNAGAVEALGRELGLRSAIFDLAEHDRMVDALRDMQLVLHCAGPFSATSAPMLSACLAARCHYLDVTGEIDVFEAAWRRADAARKADIVVCPGAGFDVVPTDCLAASLVAALPAATRLVLAFEAGGGPSRGTARTSVEGLGRGGRVRRDGQMVRVPLAWKTREIPFPRSRRLAVTVPWGDVFTAWVSTGIPNIEVYMAMPRATVRKLRWLRWLRPLLALAPVRDLMAHGADKARGPDAERRAATGTQVWGEASGTDGRSLTGTVTGPNGYDFTVLASLAMVAWLLEHEPEGGFYTPSLLMGADFAASLPGVTMRLGG